MIDEQASQACLHCGLPSAEDDRYCCYGCALAARIDTEASEAHGWLRASFTFSLLLAMTVMMLSLFLYAEDIYGIGDGGLGWMRQAYRVAAGVLTTPIIALCGWPTAQRAAERLRKGHPSMDALIVTAALAAYALSMHALFTGGRAVYFESASAALVLATLGRYLEASARRHASRRLVPLLEGARGGTVNLIDGGRSTPVPVSQIVVGADLEVPADSIVPVDLEVTGAAVEVDLGVVTGEPEPVLVRPGEVVVAGAVPVSGPVRGRALRAAKDSTLERLAALATSLQAQPSHLARLADSFAAVLTPTIWVLALAAFVYWTSVDSVQVGVVTALAVTLVACPCTYAFAAPLVQWLALEKAMAHGAPIRSAQVLERLARVDAVAFDKTGTVTDGEVEVVQVELHADEALVRGLVWAMETGSKHPAGRALARWAGPQEGLHMVQARRFVVGQGVTARDADGSALAIGLRSEALALTRDGEVLASFSIREQVRPEAVEAVRRLAADGLRSSILTGDAESRAAIVGERLGVPFEARLSPTAKLARIQALGPSTAMVGDGSNDAPALAAAGPSFAVSGATDLAVGMADVVLLDTDLLAVPWVLETARRARRLVLRLLVGSTIYNVVFVALAASGQLVPVLAGVSMLGASLLTVGVASTVGGWSGPRRVVTEAMT